MLNGKVAFVTGGSRGIGKAVALKLAEKGANIVINYRRENPELEELKKEIESKGVKALLLQGDVSDFNRVKEMIDEAHKEMGSLDILVNNAGITKDTLLMRMKEEDFDNVIDVNLKGVFNFTKHITPIMMKQRSGRIINMTSVVGITGNPGQFNYCASKAGVIGATKSAARELAARGITVNAIAPGFIESDMTDVLSDRVKEGILNSVPLKKMGKPEDVANLVAFLSSEEAAYITGQIVNVDGGMAM
ncbi:3-oxoacyl-[acyl-carrier-protein] reductase [Oceanirhabdus sp. W0125-5]|uniref:3-oxoacyl-[acyl-carrier-protein] reductase n=1 Tax=Oceanirhabdus sp. W0125-5 TaxID=2999116 RepID=UPI0022F2EEEF|nr:3-oxoacyl-[acyl-carrier-protein] reductase [Oceanirhabdus sp. W0125-5]WBW97655.1 3-oxoacyl-[acyl-carrier-protein] reductase [Oceanirhabdus sp. W0125-5]